jgi:predicted XRE-type DNA-binding protein
MSLKEEFKDREYRRVYAESFANTIIATQIRLMRGSLTQAQFADLAGLKQSRISAMEDENYSAWSTNTLKKLAAAKDVVFVGRFVSFGELLDWSRRLSEDWLRVAPFAADPAFAEPRFVKRVQRVLKPRTVAAAQGSTTFTPPPLYGIDGGVKPPSPPQGGSKAVMPPELYGRRQQAEAPGAGIA